MDDIYKIIEECNPNKKHKILIVFDDMIVGMLSNKKLNPVVTQLFIKGRKSKHFSCFYYTADFAVQKQLGWILDTVLLWKFQSNENFIKIAFNYSSGIDFINLYVKCTAKPYYILVIDVTFASDNLLSFWNNLVERMQKIIMKIDEEIRNEKLQYYINREVAKISALSSGKIGKYKYLTGKEILSSIKKYC